MEMNVTRLKMRYDLDERPPLGEGVLLSVQHVFAMFGATILVPLILGMPVSVALFCSGIGTLIYHTFTQGKSPVYLGSSFAFVGAMQIAIQQMKGDFSAALTGVMICGLVYAIVAVLVGQIGNAWVDRLLPPVVIGPLIIVIGLSLASSAVTNAGFVEGASWKEMVTAIFTFLVCAFINTRAKGFFRIVPFLISIVAGYILAAILGIVDFTPVAKASWIQLPQFYLPFNTPWFDQYHFYFGPETWAVVPVVLVTIAEHIGDHTVLSEITGKNLLKDPGLGRTLMGDGIATFVSAFLGGPANTTYGENTGVIGLTKVSSTFVLRQAAVIAILVSFLGKLTAMISTIPHPVLGGMSILLYGTIASNGLKLLIEKHVNFQNVRNLIIASAILVLGLGGAEMHISSVLTLSGTALSALTGIFLNLILPQDAMADETK
ncbi:MAG: solute carrier family 23 protein [Aerococcus sp.]|nr:solute carrier family 23 protein [Aerococcus sp.]